MSPKTLAPYGSWKSPITSDLVASAAVGLGQFQLDGQDVYWLESRPREGGRNVLMRRAADGSISELTPPGFNVRTRVHEYGGGAFIVTGGAIYFSNFADQRLWRQRPEEEPQPLTPEAPMRYADAEVDIQRNRLLCVREDHSRSDREAVNTIVTLPLDGGDVGQVLVSGHDFYAYPRLSPDGRRLAWIAWNHPQMPWDGTELWVADFAANGSLEQPKRAAGGPHESIFQPSWSPDGTLYFVSDRSGWWNLYRLAGEGVESLSPMEAEFGRPLWNLGIRTYAFLAGGSIACTYCVRGTWHLGVLDPDTGNLEPIQTPYSELRDPAADANAIYFIGGSHALPTRLVRLDLNSRREETLRCPHEVSVDPAYLSQPQPIQFPTTGGQVAYGFYYPPTNRDFEGPPDERPPLLVKSHGGPTGATSTTLRLETQFWTSRGIAVLDVNYRGSTGYGTAYRRQLNGLWGVADVDDCLSGALYLSRQGLVDARRLAISGGSAGGYTTLCALAFRNVFAVGASYYGVSDPEMLARDTHKFESRYLDSLIGPYPARRDLYLERSPLHHADRLNCPVIFFQGLEDKIVPPNETQAIAEAVKRKRLPVAALYFEGEQHGFRRAENIKRALEAELYFYSRILGFPLAAAVEPVAIENL